MIYRQTVHGTQASKPADIEINGDAVYARGSITRITVQDGDMTREEWQYEEVQMSSSEYSRLQALDASWVREWSDAMRVAERRARYERMDPRVSALRRRIDLGDDVETNTEKLLTLQTYCAAVTATRTQAGYPYEVEYPEEPED